MAAGVCLLLIAACTVDPLDEADRLTFFIGTAPTPLTESPVSARITAYEADVRRIAGVFDALELPLPARITLRLYPSIQGLEAGLVQDAGLTRVVARMLGRFAAGVAVDDTLLVLEPEFHRGPRAWLRLVAHEMAHLSQIELARGQDCGARWVAEGMADWVAFEVLDRLDASGRPNTLAKRAIDGMSGIPTDLDLAVMDEPHGFIAHAAGTDPHRVYQIAFALVQRLIERHGLDAFIDYFRACPSWTDPHAGFEEVFGRPLADFEEQVIRASRVTVSPPARLRSPEAPAMPRA